MTLFTFLQCEIPTDPIGSYWYRWLTARIAQLEGENGRLKEHVADLEIVIKAASPENVRMQLASKLSHRVRELKGALAKAAPELTRTKRALEIAKGALVDIAREGEILGWNASLCREKAATSLAVIRKELGE